MRYFEFMESIWDDYHLGGGWITETGEYYEVNHRNGLHHSDIALDEFGDDVEPNPETGEHDEYSADSAVDIAVGQGWIRVSTRKDSFNADVPMNVTNSGKRTLVSIIAKTAYKEYQINDKFFSEAPKAIRYVNEL